MWLVFGILEGNPKKELPREPMGSGMRGFDVGGGEGLRV